MSHDAFDPHIAYLQGKKEAIDEFLEDLHDRDNKRDCEYRCGGNPGEPCKSCTNYKHCDDNNYPIINKWEAKKNEIKEKD